MSGRISWPEGTSEAMKKGIGKGKALADILAAREQLEEQLQEAEENHYLEIDIYNIANAVKTVAVDSYSPSQLHSIVRDYHVRRDELLEAAAILMMWLEELNKDREEST